MYRKLVWLQCTGNIMMSVYVLFIISKRKLTLMMRCVYLRVDTARTRAKLYEQSLNLKVSTVNAIRNHFEEPLRFNWTRHILVFFRQSSSTTSIGFQLSSTRDCQLSSHHIRIHNVFCFHRSCIGPALCLYFPAQRLRIHTLDLKADN